MLLLVDLSPSLVVSLLSLSSSPRGSSPSPRQGKEDARIPPSFTPLRIRDALARPSLFLFFHRAFFFLFLQKGAESGLLSFLDSPFFSFTLRRCVVPLSARPSPPRESEPCFPLFLSVKASRSPRSRAFVPFLFPALNFLFFFFPGSSKVPFSLRHSS